MPAKLKTGVATAAIVNAYNGFVDEVNAFVAAVLPLIDGFGQIQQDINDIKERLDTLEDAD